MEEQGRLLADLRHTLELLHRRAWSGESDLSRRAPALKRAARLEDQLGGEVSSSGDAPPEGGEGEWAARTLAASHIVSGAVGFSSGCFCVDETLALKRPGCDPNMEGGRDVCFHLYNNSQRRIKKKSFLRRDGNKMLGIRNNI